MERRQQGFDAREERLTRLMTEIAARLRPVCADLPQGEFDALVERVAIVQLKYSTRRSDDLFARMHEAAPSTHDGKD